MELNEIERPFKEKGEKEKCTFDQKRKEKELNYREWDINTRFHRVKKRSGKNKDPFVIPSSIPRCINNLSSPNFFSSNSINRRVFFPGIFARNERIIFVEYIYIYKSVVPRFIGVRGSEKRGGRREEKSDRKRGCPWGLCYSVRFVGNRKTKSGSKIHEKKGGRKKKRGRSSRIGKMEENYIALFLFFFSTTRSRLEQD